MYTVSSHQSKLLPSVANRLVALHHSRVRRDGVGPIQPLFRHLRKGSSNAPEVLHQSDESRDDKVRSSAGRERNVRLCRRTLRVNGSFKISGIIGNKTVCNFI